MPNREFNRAIAKLVITGYGPGAAAWLRSASKKSQSDQGERALRVLAAIVDVASEKVDETVALGEYAYDQGVRAAQRARMNRDRT